MSTGAHFCRVASAAGRGPVENERGRAFLSGPAVINRFWSYRRDTRGWRDQAPAMKLTVTARRVLAAQYGVASREQLLDAGVRPAVLAGMVRRGDLETVERGVYRAIATSVPPEQVVMAAVLRAGPGARLSGEHALALYRVEGAGLCGAPTVLVPPGKRVRAVGFSVIASEVPPCDRAVVARVPSLRIERVVLELARTAPERRVLEVVDSARWLRLLRRDRLVRRARDLPGHPGASKVLALLGSGALGPESFGERNLQALLVGLPGYFEWGVDDVVPGVRFDVYERAARLALEYDGERDHTTERDVFADRSRELRVREAGIELIRVTKDMLRFEREITRRRIAAILRARRETVGNGGLAPQPRVD